MTTPRRVWRVTVMSVLSRTHALVSAPDPGRAARDAVRAINDRDYGLARYTIEDIVSVELIGNVEAGR